MWLFWLFVVGAVAYAFRGTLAVWWGSVRAIEEQNRFVVERDQKDREMAEQVARAFNALKAAQQAVRQAPLKLSANRDPVAGFLRDERQLDEVEAEINRMDAEARELSPDDPLLRQQIDAARASLATERRRLALAVAEYERHHD